jgi:ABC-type lipoprotein export system ATPase subunit
MSDDELSEVRSRYIGFIFQSFQLMPELTAEENVALPGLFGSASTDAVRRRARELLDQVGLSHRLSHRPGSLSGGEQQRVALARALINDPKLILADEPTGNLDPDTAAQIIANFDLLCRQQGRSLLMVSHNHGLASHADSVLYLRKGCLVENEQQARHGVITPQA